MYCGSAGKPRPSPPRRSLDRRRRAAPPQVPEGYLQARSASPREARSQRVVRAARPVLYPQAQGASTPGAQHLHRGAKRLHKRRPTGGAVKTTIGARRGGGGGPAPLPTGLPSGGVVRAPPGEVRTRPGRPARGGMKAAGHFNELRDFGAMTITPSRPARN